MSKPKVCVRFGHGGSDTGAIAKDGSYEKDINLEVGLHLMKMAEAYEDEIEFVFPRVEDIDLSLEQGVKFANEAKADLFVSIHHNAFNGQADDG